MARRKSKRRSYRFGDYAEDSLEIGSMAVVRAARAKDCKAASTELDKLRDMSSFVVRNDASKAKIAREHVAYAESAMKKSCKL